MKVVGLHVVVGAPRPGRMHEGVPPGGAAVPELLVAANRAAGQPDETPAIEHWGPVTLRGAGEVGTPEGRVTVDGERAFWPRLRVGYLAFSVGVGTDVAPEPFAFDGPIRVVRGPDLPDISLAGPWHVGPVGNRVGIRLDGERIVAPAGRGPSAPMVRGAIQLPPSGELIVLGPDHPTTGGYPVVAVVCTADVGRLFCRQPGSAVALAPISLEAARRLRMSSS